MQMIQNVSCSGYIFYVTYVPFKFSIGVLSYDNAHFINIVLFGHFCKGFCVSLVLIEFS